MSTDFENVQCPFGSEWKVIRSIGHGSYGSVYLIERQIGDETIQSAMKVIRLPASDDEPAQIMQRTGQSREEIIQYYQSLGDALLPEIQLMSKLRGDSHIVSYEDHAVVPHETGIGMDIYIRMEYLESLPRWLKGRQLTNGDVAQLGIQLCEGLETCSQYKIVHRDIKPANIFVAANGAFKLGDFGIAQRLDAWMNPEDRKLGSLNYIAPEVKRGDSFDERVDIYGVGMVMYRMLNDGRIPFLPAAPIPYTDDQEEQARQKRLAGEKLPRPAHASAILWAIVEKACSYHAEDRYANANEMGKALNLISGYAELALALPIEGAASNREAELSPYSHSTGPNGTEYRRHTGTPTPPKPREVKPIEVVVPQQNVVPPRKSIPKWLLPAGAAALVLVAVIIFLVTGVLGGSRTLTASIKQAGHGKVSVEVQEGKPPFSVAAQSSGFVVGNYSFEEKQYELDDLAPGTRYTLEISNKRGANQTTDITTDDGEVYSGTDVRVATMIVYECDRQALSDSGWFALSEANKVKQVRDDGIVLRKAAVSAQSSQWHAVITCKGNGETNGALDVLLVLRLSNGMAVTTRCALAADADTFKITAVDLDPLLNKVWQACNGWITGEAMLEMYYDGQFLIETPVKINEITLSANGGN